MTSPRVPTFAVSHGGILAVLICFGAGGMMLAKPSLVEGQYKAFEDAAVAKFTKEDHELSKAALQDALQSTEGKITKHWSNAASGAHGSVAADQPFQKDARTCRKARIENFAGKEHGTFTFTYCEVEAGKWKVLG